MKNFRTLEKFKNFKTNRTIKTYQDQTVSKGKEGFFVNIDTIFIIINIFGNNL